MLNNVLTNYSPMSIDSVSDSALESTNKLPTQSIDVKIIPNLTSINENSLYGINDL